MAQKPHALCITVPAHGHINAMLKLANILHSKGFHITFVNPEFNSPALLVSEDFDSLPDDFRLETISISIACSPSDGSNADPAYTTALLDAVATNGLELVRNLIAKLNSSPNDPPVSCMIWDCAMPCLPKSFDEFGIPQVLLWPKSASVFTTYLYEESIVEKTGVHCGEEKNEELMNMHIDFIPGLHNFRVKDLPSFFWDGDYVFHNLMIEEVKNAVRAPAVILHTFDALESEVLHAMKPLLPPVYTIGPLNCFEQHIPGKEQKSFKSNLFKENQECTDWLDSQKPDSVIYVSFGSTTVMTREQLIEFAWGLANCKHPFLWVIRTDQVKGEEATLPRDFIEETADRSMICSWSPQEKVLQHASTAVFLTHCGWNSIMDTLSAGVPVINWPFFADQQTNCWSTCVQWGTGVEIDKNAKRDAIEGLFREVMEGAKGEEMKKNAINWRNRAQEATAEGGSSYENLENLLKDVLLQKKKI